MDMALHKPEARGLHAFETALLYWTMSEATYNVFTGYTCELL